MSSAIPSLVPLPIPSPSRSYALSAMLSLLPLPIPLPDPSVEPSSPVDVNIEDDDQGNKLGHNDQEDKDKDNVQEDGDVQEGNDKNDGQENEDEADDDQEKDKVVWLGSEAEQDDTDNFIEASRYELKPKEEVCLWSDLRDKIKAGLEVAYKQKALLMEMKELLVLQNFAMLQMRRDGCITASMQITRQMTDTVGTHFGCQIFLACYYQLFEQLLPQKQEKYLNRLLLNDEQVQVAAMTYLIGLSMGEVTPLCFHCMLNKYILPSLRYALKNNLLLCMAWQWLVRLGWRNKLLRKGIYMDIIRDQMS